MEFALQLITGNIENEEKRKLYQKKCMELAAIFDSNQLSKLMNLVFKFEKSKKIKKPEAPHLEL
jgi:hypothetical protein